MIAPAPFDFDRGKSIRVRQTVRHLSRLGYEVDVLTYPSGRAVDDDSVTVERAPSLFAQTDPSTPGFSLRQAFSNLSLVRRAIQRLRTGRYDAVHAHDVDGALIAQLARKGLRTDIPLVYDMHGTFEELNAHYDVVDSQSLVRRVEQYLYDSADHLVVNWPHITDQIETRTPQTLIMDEPDGEVCDRLDALRSGTATVDRDGWEDDPYILYTGNYAPYQGIDLLIDAFQHLDNGSVRLVMTGNAPEEYVVEDPNVLYTGFVGEPRLADLLYGADVLVSPRQTDGFPPMKMLYYVRTDAPIVATDRMCHRSVLDDVDGVTFAEETPSEFATALEDALSQRPNRRDDAQTDPTAEYESVYAEVAT